MSRLSDLMKKHKKRVVVSSSEPPQKPKLTLKPQKPKPEVVKSVSQPKPVVASSSKPPVPEVAVSSGQRGRPTKYDRPMTSTERSRLARARKRGEIE